MNVRREAVRLDVAALALAHAGPYLALDIRAWGAPVALAGHEPTTAGGAGEGADGVAIVRVFGPLAQRAERDLCGYLDGYDAITSRLEKTLTDTQVGSVVLVIDSPGGDAAGCFEAVRRMRAIVTEHGKPVMAYVDELACSAAYAVATVADEIHLPPSAEAGSIGVIAVHWDQSAALEGMGVKPTVFRSGSRKADTNPIEPLSDAAARTMQARVDELAEQFATLVADARGGKASKWLALEGTVHAGQAAVDAGLADRVSTFEEVVLRAAAAAQEKRQMKLDQAFAALLGISTEATASEREELATVLQVGRSVMALAGDEKDPAKVTATVTAWRADSGRVKELEESAKQRAADGEKAERVRLALDLIQAGRLFPAEAWKKNDAGQPDPKEGVKKSWTTDTLRAMHAGLSANGHVRKEHTPKPSNDPTPADEEEAKRLGVSVQSLVASRNEVAAALQSGARAEG